MGWDVTVVTLDRGPSQGDTAGDSDSPANLASYVSPKIYAIVYHSIDELC